MLIGHDELCGLIPHAGGMCLLQGVEFWDDDLIRCRAVSHRDADNPLRAGGQLDAVNAVEYGAQAMAVHGGLLARRDGAAVQGGYLAALRDVRCHVERLDDIASSLQVEARQLLRSGGNMMYEFRVSADGRTLVEGRATVAAREMEQ